MKHSLDDMRLFWILASQGSYTRAAERLAMPVSTLSRRIRRLESDLGVRLLHRDAHRLNLTATGRRYLDGCGPLLAELCEQNALLHAERHEARGRLRISAPVSITQQWLGEALGRFALRYPAIQLELTLSSLNVDLGEQAIDLAFRVGEQAGSDWIARHLMDLPFRLYAGTQCSEWHRLSHPDQLAAHPLVQTRPVRALHLIHRHSGETVDYLPEGNVRLAVDDMQVAAQAVAQGLGIALLPCATAAPLEASGALRPIAPDWQGRPRPFYLLYRDRHNLPHRLRLLIDFMVQEARDHTLPL
ncbi:LysR family transcriptional regulator [Aeromonas diversa]|uniref:LysR family transcriptional regulator n=1 Tax=Aeromonas diversa TaxID=502790 RepID=UPI0034625C9C